MSINHIFRQLQVFSNNSDWLCENCVKFLIIFLILFLNNTFVFLKSYFETNLIIYSLLTLNYKFMKNATKLIWLLMFFASSIVFVFGQTNANKMTTEQKLSHESSVVAVPATFMDMAVKKPSADDVGNTFRKRIVYSGCFKIQYC